MRTAARRLSVVARYSPPGFREARLAAQYLRARWGGSPRVAVVLGSGLHHVGRALRNSRTIAYKSIPHFPRPRVTGHGGVLHVGQWRGLPVAVLDGRVHLYEGYSPAEVVFPIRVLSLAGVRVFIMTCAAGGIAPRATPGCFMVFSDHLNLQGVSPLAGLHDPRWGSRFVDMTQAYDRALRTLSLRAARRLHFRCFEGVYAALLGPNYETPAEIRALRRLGADAVGMSTVPEVLAARQLGRRVLAIATITNRAAGLSRASLRHQEVLEVGQRSSRDLALLLEAVLVKLPQLESA
jgi:purine-nucleoside phosphorylase